MIVTELSPHGDLLRYLWKVGKAGVVETESGYVKYLIVLEAVEAIHGTAMPAELAAFRIYGQGAQDHAAAFTTLALYQYCEQIAAGMAYLTEKHVRIY